MGVYIKNLEKPKSCAECPFEVIDISGYPRCVIMQEMVVDGNLFNRCPLIERDDTEWEWCRDCKEYDQEAHCCHRWSKVIRKTVEDVKVNYTIVTCRECNRSGTDGENIFCMWLGALRRPTAFCSYGERSE